jgi:hypothetical protein
MILSYAKVVARLGKQLRKKCHTPPTQIAQIHKIRGVEALEALLSFLFRKL